MNTMILFGLNLTILFNAIANVESDRGATSMNVYQIKDIYVDDVNRICPTMKFKHSDKFYKMDSEAMMFLYWKHYAHQYAKETGNPITYEVLAKMHNRGGRYWKQGQVTQRAAEVYWRKVKKQMEILSR